MLSSHGISISLKSSASSLLVDEDNFLDKLFSLSQAANIRLSRFLLKCPYSHSLLLLVCVNVAEPPQRFIGHSCAAIPSKAAVVLTSLLFLLLSPTLCGRSCLQQLVKTDWLALGREGTPPTLSYVEKNAHPLLSLLVLCTILSQNMSYKAGIVVSEVAYSKISGNIHWN